MKMVLHACELDGVLNKIRLSEPVIHADNEAAGRSGHLGHALCELSPGNIVAFSSNSSDKINGGHNGFGWVEFRISQDYGESFNEPSVLPFSWKCFLDGERTVSVEKAVTLSDGTIAAFCLMNCRGGAAFWEPWDRPMVVLSRDGCKTWEEPVQVTDFPGRIYDVLCYKDSVYVLELCNDGKTSFVSNLPEHVYKLFKSDDGCKTFTHVSDLPFGIGHAYGNMVLTPNLELMAFAYNNNDEHSIDYTVSCDFGKTWSEVGTSYLANRIRNPQIALLDDQYILHGRAGEQEGEPFGAFVLYTSADAKKWDEGKVLVRGRPACFYSDNLVIKMPNGKKRMLVKYSENYRDPSNSKTVDGKIKSGNVNSMMLYIETVDA